MPGALAPGMVLPRGGMNATGGLCGHLPLRADASQFLRQRLNLDLLGPGNVMAVFCDRTGDDRYDGGKGGGDDESVRECHGGHACSLGVEVPSVCLRKIKRI